MSKPESFTKTRELETRVKRLALDVDGLQKRIADTTAERDQAAGAEDKALVKGLQGTIDGLEKELEATQAGLALVKGQLTETLEVEAKAAAEVRCGEIEKEHKEAGAKYQESADAMLAHANRFVAARTAFLEAFGKASLLKREVDALTERFTVAAPKTVALPVPASHRVLRDIPFTDYNYPDHHRLVPSMEKDEAKRKRRDYGEVNGTQAGEIIQRAGLKPWPALTERQQKAADERARQRDREAEQAAGFAREAQRVPKQRVGDGLGRGVV